jgi:hypothetical protein
VWLRDQISFSTDDLQIRYSGRNDASGYAYGSNTQLRGQISGLVGTIGYSYLVTRETLSGIDAGEARRPTDQRHTLSAYLEDRMELRWSRVRSSLFHIRVLYGSGFPHTRQLPDSEASSFALVDGERNGADGRSYLRMDIGMMQTVDLYGRSVEVRQEVANLFDQFNVVGYRYLPAPDGAAIELRNALGRRVYNLSVSVGF